jgi:hypothetical protein
MPVPILTPKINFNTMFTTMTDMKSKIELVTIRGKDAEYVIIITGYDRWYSWHLWNTGSEDAPQENGGFESIDDALEDADAFYATWIYNPDTN